MDRGPTNKPIMINGKIAGIRILQAIHWANIPKTIIAASSNIFMLLIKIQNKKREQNSLLIY